MQIVMIGMLLIIVVLFRQLFFSKKLLGIYVRKYNEEQKKMYIAKMRYQMIVKLEDVDVLKKIENSEIKNFYIYGIGNHGKRLYDILESSREIKILGFIDEKESILEYKNKKVYKCSELSKKMLEDSMIIITPVFAYNEIKQSLLPFTEAQNVIGLDRIIN